MTITASGAIRFSDLQTEYGGTNPISLSEYRASYRYLNVLIFVNFVSGALQLEGTTTPGNNLGQIFTVGQTLRFYINNSTGTNIYLSSTPTPGATDLLTTGVTNNGTAIFNNTIDFDTTTYTTPNTVNNLTGELEAYAFYVKTNSQLLATMYIIAAPVPPRVRYLGNAATITWPTNLQGGSDLTLVNSGSLLTSTADKRSFIKPGQSMQFKMNCTTLGSIFSTGARLYTYITIRRATGVYPYSLAVQPQMGWDSNSGTGAVKFIGGSGLSDTANNVAALAASTCSSARVADINPITGITLQATASGSDVTWTLNNATSDVYFIDNYFYADNTFGPIFVWADAANATATTADATRAATWGIAARNRQNQQWGVPLVARMRVQIGAEIYDRFATSLGNNCDQTTLISNIRAGSPIFGLTRRDITNGLVFDIQYDASLTLTCRYVHQAAGLVDSTTSPGATNITPTVTAFSPSPTGINYNGNVAMNKFNLKMSTFYNGQNV